MTGRQPTVGIAGLSHLGLVTGAELAERGFRVIGYDPDAAAVAEIAAGRLPVSEPGLSELIDAAGDRWSVTADAAALAAADLVYVARDVPIDDQGIGDIGVIDDLVARLAPVLAPTALLVVLAQVPPGFTRGLAGVPAERRYYQVETLIFGQAVERARRPERYIVGSDDPARPLPWALAAVLEPRGCPILPMRYESAELTKIAINCFLVASLSTTAMLAEICEGIGAEWREIAPALRLDRRIGPHAYLAPGLGLGGTNLERDLVTVQQLAARHGTDAGQILAWRAQSRYRRLWVARTLHRVVLSRTPGATIAVLGLAYKEHTASTRNAPALALIDALGGVPVRAYDPAVASLDPPRPRVVFADTALAACTGADAVALMTPWPEFARLAPADIARALRGRTVIDPYGLLDADACRQAGLDHRRLGSKPETDPC